MDKETVDPFVVIEEQKEGYVRYRNIQTNKRWEVYGVCDRRGDCLIGSVIDTPDGKVQIKDHQHLNELCKKLGKERIDSELDVPVTPSFNNCCPFKYVEL